MIEIIVGLALSCLAGYIAGQLMGVKGAWYVNIGLGLVGGVVGGLVFGLFGFSSHSIISDAIVRVIGACLAIFIYRKISK